MPSDPYYKLMCSGKQKTFWAAHSRNKPGRGKYFPKPFRNLIEGMTKFKAKDRFTIEQVLEHPWFTGETPSDEEIYQEFSQRLSAVKEEQEREK
jgi:BR serine/threonine kinase